MMESDCWDHTGHSSRQNETETLRKVRKSRRVRTDLIDLLVEFSPVVVAVLTSTGHRPLNGSRVPGANTGDLAETTVGLARKAGDAPTGGDTLVTLTLSDTDSVNELGVGEDVVDGHGLLEEGDGEVDLVSDGTAVDLDLHDVGLLLPLVELADLSVGDDADHRAILLDAGNLTIEDLGLVGGDGLLVLGEGLLLGAVPVLVEAAEALSRQVLSPHGSEGAHSVGGVDVTDDADHNHGRGLENRNGFHDFTLVHPRARLVEVAHDVSHTGLIGQKGRKVGLLRRVILGEGLDLSAVPGGSLPRGEAQRTVAGSCREGRRVSMSLTSKLPREISTRELPVRHRKSPTKGRDRG